jgi:hypothetical protein
MTVRQKCNRQVCWDPGDICRYLHMETEHASLRAVKRVINCTELKQRIGTAVATHRQPVTRPLILTRLYKTKNIKIFINERR